MKPENYTDPVVLDLIEKIKVEHDASLSRHQGACEIITADGRRFEKRIDGVRGHSHDPLSDQDLERKFSEMATQYMSEAQIKQIFDRCWNVDELDNLQPLMKLMVFTGAAAQR